MTDGVPGHLVLNRKGGGPTLGTDTRKEGDRHTRGIDWPTLKPSGRAIGRKGKRVSGVHTLWATKNPAGVNLRGAVGVIGLPAVTGKGAKDEKEGEQQAQG